MKFLLALALGLLTSSVYAQQRQPNAAEQFGYASAGTAFSFISTTTVAFTSASTVSTYTSGTFPMTYRFIASQDAHINIYSPSVTTPSATTSSMLLPANSAEYFVIQPKTNIAITQDSAAGTLYLSRTGR